MSGAFFAGNKQNAAFSFDEIKLISFTFQINWMRANSYSISNLISDLIQPFYLESKRPHLRFYWSLMSSFSDELICISSGFYYKNQLLFWEALFLLLLSHRFQAHLHLFLILRTNCWRDGSVIAYLYVLCKVFVCLSVAPPSLIATLNWE